MGPINNGIFPFMFDFHFSQDKRLHNYACAYLSSLQLTLKKLNPRVIQKKKNLHTNLKLALLYMLVMSSFHYFLVDHNIFISKVSKFLQ